MFSKKMESASYTGGTNIFTLCCGFPARKHNGRRNSDELGSPKDFTDENGENEEEGEDEKDGGGGGGEGKGGGKEKVDLELTYDEICDHNEKSKHAAKKDEEVKACNGVDVGEIPPNGNGGGAKPEGETPDLIANDGNSDKGSLGNSKSKEDTSGENGGGGQKEENCSVRDGIGSDNGSHNSKEMKEKRERKEKRKKEKKEKKEKEGGENGAAYQYDTESSSDSDDEVMKHYKENLVRSASMRSAKSGRSVRNKKPENHTIDEMKSSRGSLNPSNDPMAAAELGEVVSRTSYNAESDEERHRNRSPQSTHNTTTATPTSDSPSRGQGQTFENRAFLGDGHPSMSGSDLAQSTEQLNSDEHLFDVSDLQNEPPLISKCGSLEVSFRYDNPNSRMVVVIHGARDIPSKERGGASSTQVRVMLLPGKKQRHKSKIKIGDNPVFGEKIYFNKVLPDEIPNMGLRFRLYGLERMRRERMIGESIMGFAALSLDQESTHWVVLEPRSNLTGDSGFDVSSLSRSDSASSTQSLQHGGMPELLLGLSYNGTTGRLSVEAIKGSNFRNMAMNRPPDTYVKLSLMNSLGQEVQHCKTSVRRGQPNPLFKETFMLQVALFQLPEVTLMVSVYNKKSMKKKEMIGWFSLGMNSSGEEEAAHWLDMRESKGEQVCRWHVLLES